MSIIFNFSAQCYIVYRISRTHITIRTASFNWKNNSLDVLCAQADIQNKRIKRRTCLTIELFVWKMHKITL